MLRLYILYFCMETFTRGYKNIFSYCWQKSYWEKYLNYLLCMDVSSETYIFISL